MSDPARTPYDAVIYPSYTHARSHVGHLFAQARLYGLDAAPPTACRVLEIGCGNGSSLVPEAMGLPSSRFVGVDLAAEPLVRGRRMASELGISNVEFVEADLLEMGADFGEFDYIVAHGVYSWVPPEVRDGLLRVCGELLAPNGVAFVSYLAYPGSHGRQMLRDMLLYHLGETEDPAVVIPESRSFARFIADAPLTDDPFQALLQSEARRFVDGDPAHLFHDDLTEWNTPMYFVQFAAHAAEHGLQFLSEIDQTEMEDFALPEATRTQLDALSTDRLRRQQYLDFVKCRRFRQTMLCREGHTVNERADAARIAGLYVSSTARTADGAVDLAPGVEVGFAARGGPTLSTHYPLGKAALAELMEHTPASVPFEDLAAAARTRLRAAGIAEPDADGDAELREFVLRLYGAALATVSGTPTGAAPASGPNDRPCVTPVARWQAADDGYCTALTNVGYTFPHREELRLMTLMDGTRTVDELVSLADGDGPFVAEFLERITALGFLQA